MGGGGGVGGALSFIKNVRGEKKLGSFSTDIREPRTATGSKMFPFLAWFCSLPQTEKALVLIFGLTLQMWRHENAPISKKCNFQLLSMAQKRLCLSSLISLSRHLTLVDHFLYSPYLFVWQSDIRRNEILVTVSNFHDDVISLQLPECSLVFLSFTNL